jgi:hypothetical protein
MESSQVSSSTDKHLHPRGCLLLGGFNYSLIAWLWSIVSCFSDYKSDYMLEFSMRKIETPIRGICTRQDQILLLLLELFVQQ